MFKAALFTVAPEWKQHMSINRGADKQDIVDPHNAVLFSHEDG